MSGHEEPAAALAAAGDLVVCPRRLAQWYPTGHSHLERALGGEPEYFGYRQAVGLHADGAHRDSAFGGDRRARATPTNDPPSRTAASAESSSTAASSTASKDGPVSAVTGSAPNTTRGSELGAPVAGRNI
jgi:hypothetical protein